MSRPTIWTFLHASMLVTMGHACAYLMQIVMARALSPAEFGAFNAILALSIILVAPFAVAPLMISRLLIQHEGSPEIQRGIVRRLTVGSLAVAAAIWLMHLPFAGLISSRLNVGASVSAVLLPLIVATTMLFHVPVGIWQGLRSYVMMAAGTAAVPILRFFAAAILVALAGGGLIAALWSLVLGGLIVFVWGTWSLRDQHALPAARPPAGTLRSSIAFALPASLGMLGTLGLAYVDQPVVRALATPEVSGHYAAASTLAKIALLLPSALIGILFPEATKLTVQSEEGRQASLLLILNTLKLTALLSGAAALAMFVAPHLVIGLLMGEAYGAAATYLRILAPAMMFLAIATVLVTYALARDRLEILWPTLIALAVVAIAPPVLRLDAYQTALTLLAVLAALCAACLVWLFMTHRAPGAGTGSSEPPGR